MITHGLGQQFSAKGTLSFAATWLSINWKICAFWESPVMKSSILNGKTCDDQGLFSRRWRKRDGGWCGGGGELLPSSMKSLEEWKFDDPILPAAGRTDHSPVSPTHFIADTLLAFYEQVSFTKYCNWRVTDSELSWTSLPKPKTLSNSKLSLNPPPETSPRS